MVSTINYFQILLNDNSNPCMVVDVETLDVVFINHSMKKILKESQHYNNGVIENTKCYQLLHNTYKECHHCNLKNLEVGAFSEINVYNEHLSRHYRISNTIIELNGRKFNLNKFFLPTSYTKEVVDYTYALDRSTEIFETNDLDTMTNGFLQILGEFYDADKSYIFYLDKDKSHIMNHYSWVKNDSITVIEDITQKFTTQEFMHFLSLADEHNIVEVNTFEDIEKNKTPLAKKILTSLAVDCVTLSSIKDESDNIVGAVGITNRAVKGFDYRLLHTITDFIGQRFSKDGMQEELLQISNIDFLTGFYSRHKYTEVLNSLEKNPPLDMGVIFVNINGLRKTNKDYGYAQGDNVIKSCAIILKGYFNEPIYRISGDEFVCFCIGNTEIEFLTKLDVLRHDLSKKDDIPFSIGTAWRHSHYNIQKLIVEADVVMYINKQRYYNTISDTSENITDNNTLNDLLQYLANDEFIVYLQPQVDLTTDEVVSAEALVRRFDKTNNIMVYPDDFIPLYEQKSIIRHIDIFVVEKVCELLKEWIKYDKRVTIAVNLSRVTLMEYGIVDTIVKICDKYDVPHELVIIEVTERVGLIESDVANTLVDEFKANGFKISLDDFGCAYSNIVTLAKISVDEVKVDKSLVDDLCTNHENQIIVSCVIDMCSRLHETHTLAEGIETQEQADILKEFKCTYGQGYLYSKPITTDEFFDRYIKPQ